MRVGAALDRNQIIVVLTHLVCDAFASLLIDARLVDAPCAYSISAENVQRSYCAPASC